MNATDPPLGMLRTILPDDDLASLDALGDRISCNAGQYLYSEGDLAQSAFALQDGLIMLERLASDGARQVISFVFPGDFIGIALDGRHLVSAKCLKPSRLWRYPMGKLAQLMDQRPRIDQAMRTVTNRILAHTLDQLCVLGRMTARERIVYFLLHLAERTGTVTQTPMLIDVPMTRIDMADYLGITVETVSRTISQLRREGILALPEPHRIAIVELAAVEMIAERFRRPTD
jgi:CRP/FNR family transcriptional regulator, anaerobic regulatory protein